MDTAESADSELFSENRYAYCKNTPTIQNDTDGDLGLLAIGAIVGAVAGFVGQVVSDVVTSCIKGEVAISSWQTYAGATIGGAAGGVVFAATAGNPSVATKVSSAVSGGVTTFTSGALEKLTNDKFDQSWGEVLVNTGIDTTVGFAISYIDIKIPRVTKGRNSMSAVYKSGLTKLRNHTAKTISTKVMTKGATSVAIASLAMDGYYGVKQAYYESARNSIIPKRYENVGRRGRSYYYATK